MNMLLFRNIYTDKSTIGELLINSTHFCYTLEDVVRKPGEKAHGKTAISSGKYEVVLSMSKKFKKILPELLNVPMFSGVRMHGGNTPDDTEGCIIVAKKIINNNTVYGNVVQQIIKILSSKKEKHFIEIINTF